MGPVPLSEEFLKINYAASSVNRGADHRGEHEPHIWAGESVRGGGAHFPQVWHQEKTGERGESRLAWIIPDLSRTLPEASGTRRNMGEPLPRPFQPLPLPIQTWTATFRIRIQCFVVVVVVVVAGFVYFGTTMGSCAEHCSLCALMSDLTNLWCPETCVTPLQNLFTLLGQEQCLREGKRRPDPSPSAPLKPLFVALEKATSFLFSWRIFS